MTSMSVGGLMGVHGYDIQSLHTYAHNQAHLHVFLCLTSIHEWETVIITNNRYFTDNFFASQL
jgi:hypothetical protein